MNPLHKKLTLKPDTNLLLLEAPAGISSLLEPLPEGCTVSESVHGKYDVAMLFVHNSDELQRHYLKAVEATRNEGLLWFCYPKGSSKIQTDLTRDTGWGCIMALNYQWISLISLNDKWSAFAVRVGKIAPPPAIGAPKQNLTDTDGTVIINYDTRVIITPGLLNALLKQNKPALAFFESLSFSHKKEYLIYLYGAKREETRLARLKKVEKMLNEKRKTPVGKE